MDAGERVHFGDGGQGMLFLPEAQTSRPAVIVLHERYGLVQHALDLAAPRP